MVGTTCENEVGRPRIVVGVKVTVDVGVGLRKNWVISVVPELGTSVTMLAKYLHVPSILVVVKLLISSVLACALRMVLSSGSPAALLTEITVLTGT